MKISLLNKEHLKGFLNSVEFKKMPVIPISPHRGWSHIKNPRVNNDDTLLILVYDEQNNLIGYLGLLPDDLFANGQPHHCAWMSCIWVNKKARGQGIAKKMVQKAYQIWDGKIVATEFTPEALLLYQKLNLFDNFATKNSTRVFIRFSLAEILPQKKSWLKPFSPILSGLDAIANLFTGSRWKKLFNQADLSNLIFTENRFIDSVSHPNKNGFCRGNKEIEWMINFPWLREEKQNIDLKYHFSSSAKQVKNIFVADKKSGSKLLFFIRDAHLKIPFVWGKWNENTIKNALAFVVKKYKISTITVYHPEITKILGNLPHLFQKSQQRQYLIGKKMKADLPPDFSFLLQDGDGDCGFT